MTPRKILFIITKANWGGAQKYVFDLATSLNDFEVKVVHGEPVGELTKKLKNAGIKTIPIGNLERDISFFKELKAAWSLFKILKSEKPDIIHLNSTKIGGLGAFIGRLVGVEKIIFTAHGWAFNEDRVFWQKLLIKMLSWKTILLNHKTIVLSQKEYDQVIHWPFVTKDKLELIHNGIKPINFLDKTSARNYFNTIITDQDKVVGTISELHKNKGLKYAIKAIAEISKKIKDIKFIIIGEGEERPTLEKYIKQQGLENKIFLVGQVSEASRYLKAFDIFLLSSVKEGFPFVLLEAGLAELPVISTKVGGIPEIIENNKTGILIESKDSKKIAKGLETLIENEKLQKTYGQALNNKIIKDFSFGEILKKTRELYELE